MTRYPFKLETAHAARPRTITELIHWKTRKIRRNGRMISVGAVMVESSEDLQFWTVLGWYRMEVFSVNIAVSGNERSVTTYVQYWQYITALVERKWLSTNISLIDKMEGGIAIAGWAQSWQPRTSCHHSWFVCCWLLIYESPDWSE